MDRLAKHTLNSTDSASKGQKLQSTIRLESETYEEVEKIQKRAGVSFAEACRRLISRGLDSLQGGRA